jgi:protein-S-isoprenylcysteine O-methyltransferase Ste14
MELPIIALVLVFVWAVAAVVLRSLIQRRRTGDSGLRVRKASNNAERVSNLLFTVAVVATLAGPVVQAAGLLEPLTPPTAAWVSWIGVIVTVAGIIATVLAQLAMGTSWRIGVDEEERTELVTTGIFGVVRNPIFTAMAITSLGLALTTFNVISLVGWISLVAAVQLQVRAVEEPHLVRVHGAAYAAYLARVGRFVPFLGTSRRGAAAAHQP